jgi:hypothetical protein
MEATIEDDRSDEGAGRPAAPPTAPVTGGAGDLEFDEAWAGAGAASDARPERQQRDPDPTFEDPNDR